MADYKQIALKYCREQVLPNGYKISEVWRRKLITLVEDAAVNYNEFTSGFDTDSEVRTCIETGDIDNPICEACINADYLTDKEKIFLRNLLSVFDFDFNCVRRQVCDWYISQLSTLEAKKEAIVLLLEGVENVKSDGGKYMKLSAYDASYSISRELGTNFVRQLLERGSHSNLADIRAHCFKYLLLLFDNRDYVEACLNDTSKKVRETVVRSALSGTEMGRSTRLRLSEIIKEKNLKLTKKQKGRSKNLLEQ